MRSILPLAAIFVAVSLHAQTTCSANGRFCAIGFYIDDDAGGHPAIQVMETATRMVRIVRAGCADPSVTNDGRLLVCRPSWYRDAKLEVYRIDDASLVVTKPLLDFITNDDFDALPSEPASWTLDEDGGRPRLLFPMPSSLDRKQHENVAVDVATGELETPKHDIYPPLLAELREPGPPKPWGTPRCTGPTLTFDAPRAAEVELHLLLENGPEPMLPRYPPVARKARITGYVNAQIVADGSGNTCTRITSLPFGIDLAVTKALEAWSFRRFRKWDSTRLLQTSFRFQFSLPE